MKARRLEDHEIYTEAHRMGARAMDHGGTDYGITVPPVPRDQERDKARAVAKRLRKQRKAMPPPAPALD